MKLRSIPPRTHLTLAREGKLISVARRDYNSFTVSPPLVTRGRMRPQMSRKPFEEKLAKLRQELEELGMFADEGFDISVVKTEIEEQINNLLQLLGGERW